MGEFNISIPKLGESIQEGTITKLFVKEGDVVKEEDILFELATDKVDSEIPSPVAGRIKELRCAENETYPVGQVVMVISLGNAESTKEQESIEDEPLQTIDDAPEQPEEDEPSKQEPTEQESAQTVRKQADKEASITSEASSEIKRNEQERFYSPLVRNIAEKEGVTQEELNSLTGSGLGGRVQKKDISAYIEERRKNKKEAPSQVKLALEPQEEEEKRVSLPQDEKPKVTASIGAEDTVMKMDRVRKIIANHMILSKNVSAHVTTVVEADVTNIVLWRNRVKDEFLLKHNEKLTYLPVFTEVVARTLGEFKMVNVSVDGENIIIRKHINIGIAVAKDDDNLIVPVIKDADTKNIIGLTKEINSFGNAARSNKITPDQLQDGTFTITNFGSFKNIMGTPIINQPQVAILAVGLVEKKPAVLETPTGDAIVVRHKMFLSLSYDHRVVDGMLGGKFLRRIADLLEQFDLNRGF